MNPIDTLLDTIVTDAMLADGVSPAVLQARGAVVRSTKKTADDIGCTRWTQEEDQFLQDNLGKMPLGQIAKALGRSINSVRIRYTRKGYPSPTNLPGWISLYQASKLLGVDIHSIKGWFEKGIIPGRYAFTRNMDVVMITLADLKFWATRPQHWPYFNVDKMAPGHLRRLVEKAQVRWGDEWLTTRQVADLHKLKDAKTVLTDIQHGHLKALQCPHISGRHTGSWAYWFVRKSDALDYEHPTRSSSAKAKWYTDRAAAFLRKLVNTRKTAGDAARLMKQNQKYLAYRMCQIRKQEK